MFYYHGTSDGHISKFQLGIKGKGEQIEPSNCIWLSTTFNGAKYHAVFVVGPKRNTNPNYVYEVSILPSHVIADIRNPDLLSADVASKIVKACLGWRRHFHAKICWRDALASYIDRVNPSSDTQRKNAIFSLLSMCGVSALMNPLFTWHKISYGRYNFNVFDPPHCEALALLNTNAAAIISKVPVQ